MIYELIKEIAAPATEEIIFKKLMGKNVAIADMEWDREKGEVRLAFTPMVEGKPIYEETFHITIEGGWSKVRVFDSEGYPPCEDYSDEDFDV